LLIPNRDSSSPLSPWAATLELRQALQEFRECNQHWIVERLGYFTPQQARQQLLAQGVAA
jgi:hypothetical protein